MNYRIESEFKNKKSCMLGCDAVRPGIYLQTFRRSMKGCPVALFNSCSLPTLCLIICSALKAVVAVEIFRAHPVCGPRHSVLSPLETYELRKVCSSICPVTAKTELRSNCENLPAVFMETYITLCC